MNPLKKSQYSSLNKNVNQDIAYKVNEIVNWINAHKTVDNKPIKLETSNFRVSSDGWIKGTIDDKSYLEAPSKDMWEIIGGDYNGEQLFTHESAMREINKAGKRLPTKDEFVELFSDSIPDLPMAGYRDYGDGPLSNQGSYGYYWSSSVTSTSAFLLDCSSSGVNPAYTNSRAYGFSVRCVKED